MTRSEFQVEKTAIGLQYVIPGTNCIVKPKPRAFKADWTSLRRDSTAGTGRTLRWWRTDRMTGYG